MLHGIDISVWQRNLNKDYIRNQDFVIIKASEGVTLKDAMLDAHYNTFHGSADGKPDPEKCYGFYHYARPERANGPIREAEKFLSLVEHHAGEAMFCLDWEGAALKYPITWAHEWMDHVFINTGVRPLIYTSASQLKNLKELIDDNYGLWVAHWGVKKPSTGPWPTWALWQYQVDRAINVDQDYFNGSKEQFKKYCRVVR